MPQFLTATPLFINLILMWIIYGPLFHLIKRSAIHWPHMHSFSTQYSPGAGMRQWW
jgi:hypothetical protein